MTVAPARASLSLSPACRHGVGAAVCAPLLHFQNERAGRPPRAAAWAWWMVDDDDDDVEHDDVYYYNC